MLSLHYSRFMQLIFFILFSSKILGIGVGTYYFKQLTLPYKALYFQVVIALLVEAAGAYIGLVLKEHNIWLFNIYLLFDAWLIGIPAILLIHTLKLKKIAWLILTINLFVWFANIYKSGLAVPANWSFLFCCTSVVIIYFFLLFDSGIFNKNRLHTQPLFWMALSPILYFACMIPYKGFEKYLFANDMSIARTLFNINIGLGFFRYLFLAVSFYLLGRETKNNILEQPNAN